MEIYKKYRLLIQFFIVLLIALPFNPIIIEAVAETENSDEGVQEEESDDSEQEALITKTEGEEEKSEQESSEAGTHTEGASESEENKTEVSEPEVSKPEAEKEAKKPEEKKETEKVTPPAESDENKEVTDDPTMQNTEGAKESEPLFAPMGISTPGHYSSGANSIVVPTELDGESQNTHTRPHRLWSNGNIVYVAVKSTHQLAHMTLNGVTSTDFDEYDSLVSIFIDGIKYNPTVGLQGNTKDSHWTVFKFNMADLNLNDSGIYTFFIKGIGGGHDVGGELLFVIPKTNVKAEKVWVGGTERPAITLQLIAQVENEPKKILQTTVVDGSETPAWVHEWVGVPEYDPYGRPHTFTADEETVPVNYEKSISGLTVTNTYNPDKTQIEVEKVWIGAAADMVTIQLFADGTDTGKTIELNEANQWENSFIDLNMYDDQTGEKIVYTVGEVEIPGYSTEQSGSVAEGFTFTNTNDATIDVNVTKAWIGPAASSVTIKLFAGETEVQELVLNDDNSWSATFKDLRQYDAETGEKIVYTVEEVDIPGYSSEQSGSVESGFTFTNTNDETIDIDVKKEWVGPQATSVTIKLFAGEVEVHELVLNEDGNWEGSFEELRKYDAETGEEIVYTVQEVEIPGYSTEKSGSVAEGFTFTNTNDETIDIEVVKEWIGPAADMVTISLLANGEDTGKTITLDADNDWSDTFTGERKYDAETGAEISYTVEESEVPQGYEVDYSNNEGVFIVTNTALYGSLTVEKIDENGALLAGAIFELRNSNGEVVETLTTVADQAITFENLEWGEYRLIETKAPTGYNKLIKEIHITIDADHLEVTKQVKNTPTGWTLPKTGGIGTIGFYGLGLILMVGALWAFLRRRKVQ